MHYADSNAFFEISSGPQLENNGAARLLCLKDFFKRVALFPFALLGKLWKTFFKLFCICFGVLLMLVTLGSSLSARDFFRERICAFARDLADWVLLPFALIGCFVRLILALLIHPNFYFNTVA